MYDQDTMMWSDGNLPYDDQRVDGYGTREVGTYYTQDYIALLDKTLHRNELEHEPDLEQ